MPIIAVVRPGSTDFDVQNRIQGNLDLPLNDNGRDQLAASIEQLAAWPLEAVCSAAIDPARSTAEAIGGALQLPVRIHDELQNIDHGLWQGLSLDEIKRKSPRVLKQWQDAPETVRPPEGETIQEALARALAALKMQEQRGITVGSGTKWGGVRTSGHYPKKTNHAKCSLTNGYFL